MRSQNRVILLALVAGVSSWIANAVVERFYFYGSARNFWDLLLFDIPPEELYDRIITVAAILLFGILVARMLRKKAESEAQLTRLTAELKQSNADLEQFAYMASHDLKEPLVTIGGYLRLLDQRYKEELGGKAAGYVSRALEGVQRMERLIADLLNYSRVGNHGRMLGPVDPSSVLDAAMTNLSGVIEGRKAVITRDPLHKVVADDVQFLQLFQNLISNGIKFCRDPSPRIHVSALRNERNETVFSVRDNGIGIAPEHAEEIFQVFRRVHARNEFPGTGIGLALCKRIVERHGGRIWVESFPGGGSTFFFSIPDRGVPPRFTGMDRPGTPEAA